MKTILAPEQYDKLQELEQRRHKKWYTTRQKNTTNIARKNMPIHQHNAIS